jgi:Protein of unknown function (DUF3105)
MSSRREEKEKRRQERLERERAERARTQRQRRLYAVLVGAALVAAAVIAVVAVATSGGDEDGGTSGPKAKFENASAPPEQQVTDLDAAARAAGCIVRHPPIEGRTHLRPTDDTPKYGTDPPTSGNHDALPAQDGVYATAPKPRNYVHTLEHGRVEIHYKPSIPPSRLRQLGGLYNEDPYLMVLLPNDTMPYTVAAAAWGHLIGCRKLTDKTFDALRAFRDRYRDQAPEPAGSQPANSV